MAGKHHSTTPAATGGGWTMILNSSTHGRQTSLDHTRRHRRRIGRNT